MINNDQSVENFKQLTDAELLQVGGAGDAVTVSWPSGQASNLLDHLELTGGSFRPITWFDLLGSGKQIYIDGMPIDTEGKLGPRA